MISIIIITIPPSKTYWRVSPGRTDGVEAVFSKVVSSSGLIIG